MSAGGQYRHLFTPLRLGPLTVPNRIVFSAHLTNYAEDGLPTEQHAAYYGGPGGRRSRPDHHRGALHPRHRLALREADPRVRPRGHPRLPPDHRGRPRPRRADPRPDQPQRRPGLLAVLAPAGVGPQPGARPAVPRGAEGGGAPARSAQIVDGYATVAEHCRAGGFDGIELQCSHSSIVRGFLSPATNHRTDGYGGPLEQPGPPAPRDRRRRAGRHRARTGPWGSGSAATSSSRGARASTTRWRWRGWWTPPVRSTTSTPRSGWPPPPCT